MPKSATTGIIVGRFQVFELNPIHRRLIGTVQEKHEHVLVFLARNPSPSDRHPLDWAFRWSMFEETYGGAIGVLEMPDLPDDRVWSQELDRRIMEQRPTGEVTLYGTDQNFVQRYSGKYPTEVLEAAEADFEGVEMEEGNVNFRDFRAGVIYGMLSRYPTVYPTVDIAVFDDDFSKILLARKPSESKYRLPGGFTDPEDISYEEAAYRELGEECGEITVSDLFYLGSAKIDDWRYRGSRDSVMTHLFMCNFEKGEPTPSDDIAELRWMSVKKVNAEMFVPEHQVLWNMIQEFLEEEEE
ncbi:MAG TPA: NUDIX domain-containing protein [Saprospiraceae bacterium]|nr:NUDIX domain-containing protein [Saprospiraceae bacterium]HND90113.1 NUDIX domain-containing protein [Saprospiraceae bacterium]